MQKSDAMDLARIFAGINDPGKMHRFLFEIFTPAEIDDFVLRWRLLEMLYCGSSQREIARRLGISLCKITRGSRILKSGSSVTESILESEIGDENDKCSSECRSG